MRRKRPDLRIELGGLGTVDPFGLEIVEEPPGSGEYFVSQPGDVQRASLDLAGLSLVGAGQALLGLSMRWMTRAGRDVESPPGEPPFGEVRMIVRRKEARLLAALLRRHLDRLPQPPSWMPELHKSLVQIDEFLRWEEH